MPIHGDTRASTRRRLGQLLVVTGLVLAARPFAAWVQVKHYQWAERRGLVERAAEVLAPGGAPVAPSHAPRPGEAIGILDIPRLGLSAVVAHGDEPWTLDVAIGHLPDTPLPWAATGNSALAGHRDTFFRPLRLIQVGDDIVFRGPGRMSLRYQVTETRVVRPEDVWVLAPTRNPSLTLITCFPFDYVGAAPQRFIVSAVRLETES